MAGNPKRRAMIAELTRLAVEEFGDELQSMELAPLEYAAFRVASGTTITELARELTLALAEKTGGQQIHRESLRRYLAELQEKAGGEGERSLARARERGAWALAERASSRLEDAADTKTGLLRARLQAEQDWKLAERWNKELQIQKAGVQVAISFGGMHLDALRARAVLIDQQDAGGVKQLNSGAAQANVPALEVEHEVLSD